MTRRSSRQARKNSSSLSLAGRTATPPNITDSFSFRSLVPFEDDIRVVSRSDGRTMTLANDDFGGRRLWRTMTLLNDDFVERRLWRMMIWRTTTLANKYLSGRRLGRTILERATILANEDLGERSLSERRLGRTIFERAITRANEDLGERLLEHLAPTRHEGELPFPIT